MKNVVFILFFAVAFSSCNTSFSGDTTCLVQMYDPFQIAGINSEGKVVQKLTQVKIRKADTEKLHEGQDVWLYQYYNSNMGEASEWRVVKYNRYGIDTTIIEEVMPNYGAKTSTYKKARLVKL